MSSLSVALLNSSFSDFLWAMLGLESIDSFTAVSDVETTVVRILLTLWQTISVLVLLTMLIALITHAFDQVQVTSTGQHPFIANSFDCVCVL